MRGAADLVERVTECDVLGRAHQDAAAASGRLVLVEGPAGIGKTSLLAHAADLARSTGDLVLTARADELERQLSLGVVRQLLGPAVDRGNALLRAAPTDPPVGDFTLLDGLFQLCARLAEQRPVTLVVDDLHWADHSSLRFLAYLRARLEGLRLLVVGATRPHEPGADQPLLDLLLLDETCTVLRPAALSPAGSASVLRAALARRAPDDAFLAACHQACGGNPLLLGELTAAVLSAGIALDGDNVDQVTAIGSRALARRVRARLASLPAACAALAGAVAVHGEGAPLHRVAALAEIDVASADVAAGRLVQIDVLRRVDARRAPVPEPVTPGEEMSFAFVHPLVREAVYDGLDPRARRSGHARAAHLLREAGADPERVAAHILRAEPDEPAWYVEVLRRAADLAMRRGAARDAAGYLEHCLRLAPELAPRVGAELGLLLVMPDPRRAGGYLREALLSAREPARRVVIADGLATTLFMTNQLTEAVDVYQSAIAELDDRHADARSRLRANLINFTLDVAQTHDLARDLIRAVRADAVHAGAVRVDASDRGVGSRMLNGMIALYDAAAGLSPDAVALARRCVEDGAIVIHGEAVTAVALALWVQTAADDPDAPRGIEAALARARPLGSMQSLMSLTFVRGCALFWRGALAEAEAACEQALRYLEAEEWRAVRQFITGYLADALLEQGRPRQAARLLTRAWPVGEPPYPSFRVRWLADVRARLALLDGRPDECLRISTAAGREAAAHGWVNPAFFPWRSTSASALDAMGRAAQARALAAEEVELARAWGAPRALGHALRVAGLVERSDGADGAAARLFGEAVDVLADSPARLEYAKALVDLGVTTHRAGEHAPARRLLSLGLDVATECGAEPLARLAAGELRAAGGRPRRVRLTGLGSLTPSERRVAELAGAGLTNRAIASRLFVTVKTVEMHLANTYRKLGITCRDQLREHLPRVATEGI
ncbi:helix-turn-helix transcriptional regulator [Frankia nepalensis]|uniref:AAA family ATPase n=1 Tax=Frankia nepalensis TaxID=1836974 RepID=A0A937UQ12_9ACTN|nr:LuxR family transcriptional regulator [Frankia nepalensis]MBL7498016.1 AAA family ATPase [Frankia nepalensis]MBL7509098.1 AAA family ATPase [Frankia nepalensis]MBL7627795.1 AAA family ATPase [Frankia nepalensis]